MNQIASGQNIPAWSIGAAVAFVAVAMWAGFHFIGLPPVVIVGGSGVVALVLWLWNLPSRSDRPCGHPAGTLTCSRAANVAAALAAPCSSSCGN